MATTRGIKKVSENILSDGRAIIVTEKDKDNYVWADIPNGSLFIDTTTGIMQVKIEGESDWVPAGLKNDGTLCIAKDTKLVTEIYTIVNPDEGNGNFSFKIIFVSDSSVKPPDDCERYKQSSIMTLIWFLCI